MKNISDLVVKGKTVLIRVDFNVPLDEQATLRMTSGSGGYYQLSTTPWMNMRRLLLFPISGAPTASGRKSTAWPRLPKGSPGSWKKR